jgi:hypothetical protein
MAGVAVSDRLWRLRAEARVTHLVTGGLDPVGQRLLAGRLTVLP